MQASLRVLPPKSIASPPPPMALPVASSCTPCARMAGAGAHNGGGPDQHARPGSRPRARRDAGRPQAARMLGQACRPPRVRRPRSRLRGLLLRLVASRAARQPRPRRHAPHLSARHRDPSGLAGDSRRRSGVAESLPARADRCSGVTAATAARRAQRAAERGAGASWDCHMIAF